MADAGRDNESERPMPAGAKDARPRTPVLLWVVMLVMVVMMVAWSIRHFGTRSSAEPGTSGGDVSGGSR